MRIPLPIAILLFVFCTVESQAPLGFNYQAAVRDSNGSLKANQNVVLQVNLVQGTIDGIQVYSEVHNTASNDIGIVNVVIGRGATSGDLNNVEWSKGPYFIEILVDGTYVGTTQLLSVPYALYAASGNPGPPGPEGPQGPAGETGDSNWQEVSAGMAYDDGRVGIGTMDPRTHLHVNGSDTKNRGQLSLTAPAGENTLITLYQDNTWKAYLWWDDSEGDLRLQNYTRSYTNINPYGGNVGIGTITPQEKLDVRGNVRITGDLIVEGSTSSEDIIYEIELLKEIIGIGTLTDVDGNDYNTKRIGNQLWMTENLKVTHLNDGIPLEYIDNLDTTLWADVEGYTWYNLEGQSYEDTYGGLYNVKAVITEKLCPIGWHVSSDADWDTLVNFLGGEAIAGGKLKKTGFDFWELPNVGATNQTGFTALPGGSVRYNEASIPPDPPYSYVNLGKYGFWWSPAGTGFIDKYVRRSLHFNSGSIGRFSLEEDPFWIVNGLSVRCVKD